MNILCQKSCSLFHGFGNLRKGADYVIATKGAPEAIADLCHFDRTQTEDLSRHINSMADEGLRVLGVAQARFKETTLPGIAA